MSERHSATVAPLSRNTWTTLRTKIETNRIWLKLFLSLLIPLMIGVFTITMSFLQQNISLKQRIQDKDDARQLREQSDSLADNLQKETILVNYLNDISKLLMSENQPKMYEYIRTKTLTTLRQLDPDRKRYLLLFLYESRLLLYDREKQIEPILEIQNADLNGVKFIGTEEEQCSFNRMKLYDINLSNSSFHQCFIDRTDFSYSIMNNAMFYRGLLIRTTFKFTSLKRTCFCHMKLANVSFLGANLIESQFSGTIWDKKTVLFTNANLTGASLSKSQLENSTLFNCILPSGEWGPIQTENVISKGDLNENCNSNALDKWSVMEGKLQIFRDDHQSDNRCYFRVISFNSSRNIVYLVQNISLDDFTLLISTENARYNASATFQCIGTQYATMLIQQVDINGLRDDFVAIETANVTHIQSITISNKLRPDTRQIRMLITIFRSRNNSSTVSIENNACSCYSIKLLISKIH